MEANLENSERVRSKNFGQNEINLLVNLVGKYKHIIECKQSGAVSNKNKLQTWEKLAQEFNSESGCLPRGAKILRDKWSNIKKTATRNYAADKKYRCGTGGGPNRKRLESSIDFYVREILDDRLTGMVSQCDSDSPRDTGNTSSIDHREEANHSTNNEILHVMNLTDGEDNNDIEQLEEEINKVQEIPISAGHYIQDKAEEIRAVHDEVSGITINDWSDFTPRMLRKAPSRPLQQTKKSKKSTGGITNQKWCDLADEKNNVCRLKRQYMMAEESRKEEMHEIKKRHLEEEHQLKIQLMKEEHMLKMKLLAEK